MTSPTTTTVITMIKGTINQLIEWIYETLEYNFTTPLQRNIIVCIIMILYIKIISIECINYIKYHFNISTDYTKQLVYITFSTSIIFWPLFNTNDWSWRLNIIIPTSMLIRFLYKGAVRKDPEDEEVQILSKSSSPSELLFGPVQYVLVWIFLGLYCFMEDEAAIIIAALGIGDAIAPIIGTHFGRHVYHMPFCQPKTLEGSICVFLGTCSASYFYLYALGRPLLPLRIVLAYSGIASVVEGTMPGTVDNICVPIVLHFSMDRVQHWLPA